jgi:hypothetical protein
VIKERISEGIRGAISECETAVEYLEKVESQFTGSSKAYASSLIKRPVSEKYTSGGVRDHFLRVKPRKELNSKIIQGALEKENGLKSIKRFR